MNDAVLDVTEPTESVRLLIDEDLAPLASYRPSHRQSLSQWLCAGIRLLDETLKRDLDVLSAIGLLLLLLPLILLIALLVSLDGGPVLFAHTRIGRHGVAFKCWKFRTMILDADVCLREYLRLNPDAAAEWDRAQKLIGDPRVTFIGGVLRRVNLDELPQIWNVLRGDMSLVGPRPVTDAEITERYRHDAAIVTAVRPGVTGSWQIQPNRNDIAYPDRVQFDVVYAKQRNLVVDLALLGRTVPVMLHRAKVC